MKTILILLTLISLVSSSVIAQTAPTTVPLTKGQAAPFDGVELNNSAATANQLKLEKADLTTQQNVDLNKAIDFKDNQITDLTNAYTQATQQRDMFSKEALAENEQLQKQQKDQTLDHILYFGGGAAIVLILDFIVRSATKNN